MIFMYNKKEVIMKKLLQSILLITFCTYLGFAGGDAMNSAGDKALLFHFNGLSNLGAGSFLSTDQITVGSVSLPSFNAIGVKYYFSNGFAGKGALLFGYNSETEKAVAGGFSDKKESNIGFGLEVGIQSDIVKSGSFLGYIGAVAGFAYLTGTFEPSVVSPPPTGTTTKHVASLTNFGVGGVLGFEYFIFDRISLGAEYQFGAVFGSGTFEVTRQGLPTTKQDLPSLMSLGFNTVSFKLAAYF